MQRAGVMLVVAVAMGAAQALAALATSAQDAGGAVSELGLLDPVSVTAEVTVPREGLWLLPQGSFVCADTVQVKDDRGMRLSDVMEDPERGQYRIRLDGGIRFSRVDAGRKMNVSYRYRPRRAALLPARASTDYRDAVPTLEETLGTEMQARGFALASQDDVANALVECERSIASQPAGGDGGDDGLVILARRLNVACLVLPSVDADEESVFAGFYTYGSTKWNGTVSNDSVSAKAQSFGTTTRVDKRMMQVAVGLTVYQGDTGDVAFQQVKSGSKRVHFRQFGPARRSLIRDLIPGLVSRWREQHP